MVKVKEVIMKKSFRAINLHWSGSGSSSGGASLRSSSSHRDWGIWRPGGYAIVQHNRTADNVVSHVKVEVLFPVTHGEQQLRQIVGVKG